MTFRTFVGVVTFLAALKDNQRLFPLIKTNGANRLTNNITATQEQKKCVSFELLARMKNEIMIISKLVLSNFKSVSSI